MEQPPSEIQRVAEEFFREHNIVPTPEVAVDYPAVYLVSMGRKRLDENLLRALESGTATPGAAWGVLRWMALRGFDQADAGFIAIATGAVPSAEVISERCSKRHSI